MKPIFLFFIFVCAAQLLFSQDYFNRTGKDRALFFAVDDYQSMSDLKNPIKNAREIANALQSLYGFEVEVVPNPSGSAIENKIAAYKQSYQQGLYPSDGQLFIFFTGHGTMKGKNGYFMPADANPQRPHRTAIEYDYWRDEINEIDCKHILVAIDACHSITFDPNWEHKTGGSFSRPGERYKDQVLTNHQAYRTRIFFTSDAEGNQTPDRSTFARQLLTGLRTHQTAVPYMTSSELFANYMLKAAPTPGGGSFGSDEVGSNFLFFNRSATTIPADQYSQRQSDIDAYKALLANPSFSAYEKYLADYPNGNFKKEVTRLLLNLKEEQDWEMAQLKNTEDSYTSFLIEYPNNIYAAEAQKKLQQLRSNSSPDAFPPLGAERKLDTTFKPLGEDVKSNRGLDTSYSPDFTRKTHEVRWGESLKAISKIYNISVERLIEINPQLSSTGIKQGMLLYVD